MVRFGRQRQGVLGPSRVELTGPLGTLGVMRGSRYIPVFQITAYALLGHLLVLLRIWQQEAQPFARIARDLPISRHSTPAPM